MNGMCCGVMVPGESVLYLDQITREQAAKMRDALRAETRKDGRQWVSNRPMTVKLPPGDWALIDLLLHKIANSEEVTA